MRHAYQRPIKLPDVSAQANLSPYHFLRVYKQTFQETPHEFLTRLRIEKAKTLLARGSHNVTEACFEVASPAWAASAPFSTTAWACPPPNTGVTCGRKSRSRGRSVRCSFPRASLPCSTGLPERDKRNFREAGRASAMYPRTRATT